MLHLDYKSFVESYDNCNYEDLTENLKSHTSLLAKFGSIFNYRGDPNEEKYDFFYRHCQAHLFAYSKAFNFYPAYLYIAENDNFNNIAQSCGTFAIGISKTVIEELNVFFYDNLDFENDESLINFRDINSYLISIASKNLNQLIFEFGAFFSYYHELAHLLHESNVRNNDFNFNLEEYGSNDPKFKVDHHLREIDCDAFAANQIAKHMLTVIKDAEVEFKIDEILYNLTIFLLASIFAYRIRYFRGLRDMYYFEKSHPHPVLRIIIISKVILTRLIKVTNNNEISDTNLILSKSLEFADKIAGVDYRNTFSELVKNGTNLISEYLEVMSNESKKYPFLLVNRF